MRLGINNIDVTHIINELYKQKKFKVFILLCPRNFDIQSLVKHLIP
jgi:hypothetical protein